MLRAVAVVNGPRLLAASAVAASVTGTVNETALATVTIPGGAMGLNGGLHIHTTWSHTNSVNNKTLRARLGGIAGTQYMTQVATTTASLSDFRRVRNRNSASSQVGATGAASVPYGATGAAIVTSAVDMSASVDLVLSGQLASAGETITLENYEVWLVP
jgi:hypothetical protein